MSNPDSAGFAKFVPGFDFLQGLAKQATSGVSHAIPQLPNLSNWVAPTLNVEELEKRIEELKAVQFWLDQNALALKATIQALEVQKMTLATLKGMNFNMGDVANAVKIKAVDTMRESLQKSIIPDGLKPGADHAAAPPPPPEMQAATPAQKSRKPRKSADTTSTPNLADPTAWWGALTQQFQEIAVNAISDVARHTSAGASQGLGKGLTKGTVAAATGVANAMGTVVKEAMTGATGTRMTPKTTSTAKKSSAKAVRSRR